MSDTYWWCGQCRAEVDDRSVTYQERHETCGYPLVVVGPQDEIARLRAELAELRKPDLRTVLGFEAGREDARAEVEALVHDNARYVQIAADLTQECEGLRARVAELEAALREIEKLGISRQGRQRPHGRTGRGHSGGGRGCRCTR